VFKRRINNLECDVALLSRLSDYPQEFCLCFRQNFDRMSERERELIQP